VLYGSSTGGVLGTHWGNEYVDATFQFSWFSPMTAVLDELCYGSGGYPNYNPVIYF
jgi:hypothetical protein